MRKRQSGSILILSLWMLFFLAALTVASVGHAVSVLQTARHLQSRVAARMDAVSTASLVAAVIAEQIHDNDGETNVWDGVAADAWNRDESLFVQPSEMARDRGEVQPVYFTMPEEETYGGVVGEGGRLHLNANSPDVLRQLFRYVGGDEGEAVARQLFHDRDETNLEEQNDDTKERPKFSAIEDLLLEDGVDTELFSGLLPHLTVYGDGAVLNINSATRPVLVAYFMAYGEDDVRDAESIADALLAARAERSFESWDDFNERIDGVDRDMWSRGPMGVSSTAFRGIATGVDVSGEVSLEIEFVWDGETGQFVLWREL